MTTGEKIRVRRTQLGITTQKLADACGVNKSTVSRWETGETGKINLGMLMLLAKNLYLQPQQLLSDDSEELITDNSLFEKVLVKLHKLSKEDLAKVNNMIDLMF